MSENEVIIKSGKSLPFGSERLEIRDDGVPVKFVDLITELRQVNGVIHIGLGSTVWDAGNDAVVAVASRVRMDLIAAQNLHKFLGDAITDALKPADKSTSN